MNDRFSADSNDRMEEQIAAYVRGTLDEAAVEVMELRMLEDPALLARVEEQRLMAQGLRTAPLEFEISPQRTRWPAFMLAGALSLVVAVLGAWAVTLNDELDRLRSPQAAVTVLTLHDQRSLLADRPQAFDVGYDGPLLVEVDVSAHPFDHFSVVLTGIDKPRRWAAQKPDERGYLTIYFHTVPVGATLQVLDPEGRVLRTENLGRRSAVGERNNTREKS